MDFSWITLHLFALTPGRIKTTSPLQRAYNKEQQRVTFYELRSPFLNTNLTSDLGFQFKNK